MHEATTAQDDARAGRLNGLNRCPLVRATALHRLSSAVALRSVTLPVVVLSLGPSSVRARCEARSPPLLITAWLASGNRTASVHPPILASPQPRLLSSHASYRASHAAFSTGKPVALSCAHHTRLLSLLAVPHSCRLSFPFVSLSPLPLALVAGRVFLFLPPFVVSVLSSSTAASAQPHCPLLCIPASARCPPPLPPPPSTCCHRCRCCAHLNLLSPLQWPLQLRALIRRLPH